LCDFNEVFVDVARKLFIGSYCARKQSTSRDEAQTASAFRLRFPPKIDIIGHSSNRWPLEWKIALRALANFFDTTNAAPGRAPVLRLEIVQ